MEADTVRPVSPPQMKQAFSKISDTKLETSDGQTSDSQEEGNDDPPIGSGRQVSNEGEDLMAAKGEKKVKYIPLSDTESVKVETVCREPQKPVEVEVSPYELVAQMKDYLTKVPGSDEVLKKREKRAIMTALEAKQ